MASLCHCAAQQEDYHLGNERKNRTDHYRFLYSIRADCVECVQHWLHLGANLHQGTEHHPDWNAVAWAEHFKAKRCDDEEIVSLIPHSLTPSLTHSLPHSLTHTHSLTHARTDSLTLTSSLPHFLTHSLHHHHHHHHHPMVSLKKLVTSIGMRKC